MYYRPKACTDVAFGGAQQTNCSRQLSSHISAFGCHKHQYQSQGIHHTLPPSSLSTSHLLPPLISRRTAVMGMSKRAQPDEQVKEEEEEEEERPASKRTKPAGTVSDQRGLDDLTHDDIRALVDAAPRQPTTRHVHRSE